MTRVASQRDWVSWEEAAHIVGCPAAGHQPAASMAGRLPRNHQSPGVRAQPVGRRLGWRRL